MPCRFRQDTQRRGRAPAHPSAMSDFAGLSVPMLKNLLFALDYTAEGAEKQEERRSLASRPKIWRLPHGFSGKRHKGARFVKEFFILRAHRRGGYHPPAETADERRAADSRPYGVSMMACWLGFVCISFSLAGDGKKKSRDSPVFALAHAQATGLCGQHSNPPARQERAAQTGGPFLAKYAQKGQN